MSSRLRWLFTTCAGASVVLAQPGGAPGDWPTYSRDLAGTRYSPLTEITRRNVGGLVQAWSVPVARSADDDDEAPGPSGNPQATPIVVDGVMYLPVRGHEVLALDAATGEEIWRTALPTTEGTEARGVAYWPGDGSVGARILVMSGPTLVALDAATGVPARGFGRDGVAQVVVPWRGVPLVYGNLAILGTRTGELNQGLAGDTRAYDARTGQLVWTFHTVPLPGETGHETWLDHGWRNRSGANVWAYYMTLDAARGMLYMPVSSAAGNYWGGDRPGSNLFGNSIVAVMPRRVGIAGTSRPCITTYGISTCRTRPCSSTSSATAARCPRSRRSARRPTCSSSIARRVSPCSASRSGPCPRVACPTSGTRRRSRSP